MILVPCLVYLFIWGCAAQHYAQFKYDDEVTGLFRTSSVPEEYQYYIIGRENLPNAIVGIKPEYALEEQGWRKISPNDEDFQFRVDHIFLPMTWVKFDDGQGAWLMSPDGDVIGIYYSMYPSVTIKIKR